MQLDAKAFGEAVVAEVKRYVEPLVTRLAALEARPVPAAGKDGVGVVGTVKDETGVMLLTLSNGEVLKSGIRDGKDGQNGKDIEIEAITALIKAEVAQAFAAHPAAADREGPAAAEIARLVAEAVKTIALPAGPQGEPGEPGRDGAPGPAGADGKDGIEGKQGPPGEPGDPGEPGRDGRDGAPGAHGQPGRDGADGKDGAAGRDGLGFEDLSVTFDGVRTLSLRFVRGGEIKEFPVTLPIVIDRGVWRDGDKYVKGDGVTWGGSFFIAQRDTEAKPETDDSWRLAVKRGRDGKDGKMLPTEPPTPVRVGKPANGKG